MDESEGKIVGEGEWMGGGVNRSEKFREDRTGFNKRDGRRQGGKSREMRKKVLL